ncbi:hypothetical protein B0H19DRAFT_1079470 [Mycena capillaripes]|nr:hypothetical protein B0H19DRAFT_1079470 [Mycena capillaripes]
MDRIKLERRGMSRADSSWVHINWTYRGKHNEPLAVGSSHRSHSGTEKSQIVASVLIAFDPGRELVRLACPAIPASPIPTFWHRSGTNASSAGGRFSAFGVIRRRDSLMVPPSFGNTWGEVVGIPGSNVSRANPPNNDSAQPTQKWYMIALAGEINKQELFNYHFWTEASWPY